MASFWLCSYHIESRILDGRILIADAKEQSDFYKFFLIPKFINAYGEHFTHRPKTHK